MRLLRGLQQFIQLRNPVDVVDNLRARQIRRNLGYCYGPWRSSFC